MAASLVSYSDSDGEDYIDNELNVDVSSKLSSEPHVLTGKRKSDADIGDKSADNNSKTSVDTGKNTSFSCKKIKLSSGQLPLPEEIRQLYNNKERKHKDDVSLHEGRVRSFEHEEGNWATLVHIKYDEDERLNSLVDELFTCLHPFDFKPMKEHHISLSRTVVVRHHWIKPLTESLREKLGKTERCFCEITNVKLYTNDEKTRTFLAMEVVSNQNILARYIQTVDDCFQEFKLQKYYETPSFHISIGWCLGNVIPKIDQHQQLQGILDDFLEDNPDMKVVEVKTIHCKIGNKFFLFPLNS